MCFQKLLKLPSLLRENTSDINPYFYEVLLRLLVNEIEGKITEFLNALLRYQSQEAI